LAYRIFPFDAHLIHPAPDRQLIQRLGSVGVAIGGHQLRVDHRRQRGVDLLRDGAEALENLVG
jgi:hypothetical protein